MNEVPCGPARDREVDEKLDSLLEFLGEVASDVKDLRRRVANLEFVLRTVSIGVDAYCPG